MNKFYFISGILVFFLFSSVSASSLSLLEQKDTKVIFNIENYKVTAVIKDNVLDSVLFYAVSDFDYEIKIAKLEAYKFVSLYPFMNREERVNYAINKFNIPESVVLSIVALEVKK